MNCRKTIICLGQDANVHVTNIGMLKSYVYTCNCNYVILIVLIEITIIVHALVCALSHLQIADCVFYGDLRRKTQCNLILVFNGGCNRQSFYGIVIC